MRSACRLPQTARIRSDADVHALQSAARLRGRWFLVRHAANDKGYARLAVRVAKQVSRSAVARNRIRRCVREVFRQQRGELPALDYFISLIYAYRESSLASARRELERLLRSERR